MKYCEGTRFKGHGGHRGVLDFNAGVCQEGRFGTDFDRGAQEPQQEIDGVDALVHHCPSPSMAQVPRQAPES